MEQEQLLQHIRGVVPDDLLAQLLTSWLQPPAAAAVLSTPPAAAAAAAPRVQHGGELRPPPAHAVGAPAAPATAEALRGGSSSTALLPECGPDCPRLAAAAAAGHGGEQQQLQGAGEAAGRAPIKEIVHIHRTICCALEEFVKEARGLHVRADVTAAQLGSLVERHRYARGWVGA